MTVTDRSTATKRVPMDSLRKTALVAGALIPHPFDRIFAVPVGLAMAWLGYALLSERREQVS